MHLLEQRILRDGKVLEGNVLKVDGFLNHCIDPAFSLEMGKEFYRLYKDSGVNKILTIEASGIGLACMTGLVFNCSVLFAKKRASKNISNDVYCYEIPSYTHGNTNTVVVSREYLGPEDRVLILDDFLATGAALDGLILIALQAKSTVVGCGVAIEKAFQDGGERIRRQGYRVESLARISFMSPQEIRFAPD